jgi:hypothetical protein
MLCGIKGVITPLVASFSPCEYWFCVNRIINVCISNKKPALWSPNFRVGFLLPVPQMAEAPSPRESRHYNNDTASEALCDMRHQKFVVVFILILFSSREDA